MLRGLAIILMIAYHCCFDLNYYRVLSIDFNNAAFWLSARACIVSLFLLLVGISLHLATRRGLNWPRYLRRLGSLVAAAAMVSVASYQMFPQTFIYFGILHFIALASLLGLAFTRFYWLNLGAGIVILSAGLLVHSPAFNSRGLGWIGFMTFKPPTEDYVPVFPWFGVVLIGLFLGRWLFSRDPLPPLLCWRPTAIGSQLLAFSGRHSLLIYLLHQPVLLGILWLFYGTA